jgi:hypothetical protein
MGVDQTGELDACALPLCRLRQQVLVLAHEHAAQCARPIEQLRVRQSRGVIPLRGQDVHPLRQECACDRIRRCTSMQSATPMPADAGRPSVGGLATRPFACASPRRLAAPSRFPHQVRACGHSRSPARHGFEPAKDEDAVGGFPWDSSRARSHPKRFRALWCWCHRPKRCRGHPARYAET